MIVLVGSEKGGAGKTTIATNLAAAASASGLAVMLLDADAQESASDWAKRREEEGFAPIACKRLRGRELREWALRHAPSVDLMVIDAGGRDSAELRAAMTAADIMIIPTQASQFDLWALSSTHELTAKARGFNPKLDARVLFNRVSDTAAEEITEAREALADMPAFAACGVEIRDRPAYRQAAVAGCGVVELSPADPAAAEEMSTLLQEVRDAGRNAETIGSAS